MFLAAKLLAFLTQPLAWVLLLIVLALLSLRWRRRWTPPLLVSAATLLLVLGWQPLPDALLRQLENRYPALAPDANLQAYIGVIVLGGALESDYVWNTAGQSALNDSAERMTEVLPLLRRQPALKIVFTGGEGELFTSGMSEATRARHFFTSQGIAAESLLLESASRTTYENALLSKQLAGVEPTKRWLLLTSAWHMPRAMATFEKLGWNVTACPVDFRSGSATPWSEYSMHQGAHKWHTALHEWLGLLAYWLSGRL